MIIAVLGGGDGHDASAIAADLALAGHRVRLWQSVAAALEELGRPPTVTLAGEGRAGKATLEAATGDVAAVLAGAEVVIAALPATAHDDLAGRLAPHLSERQLLLLPSGGFGSFAVARALTRAGARMPSAIAETGPRPLLARSTGPGAVNVAVRAAQVPVGVFPASRSAATLAVVKELLPGTRPCADVLDAALTSAAAVLHPALVLLNLAAIDRGPFDLHAGTPTASVRRMIDAVDAERVAARVGWGYAAPHDEVATYLDDGRSSEGQYGPQARVKIAASGLWNEALTVEHPYVTEDAALGLSLLESAARTVTIASPATSGLLSLFGVLLGRELSGRGRALEHLGLGDLSRREIQSLLVEGWTSPLWSRVNR